MIGGLRAAACLKIKAGPWKSLVGIGTERKRSAEKIPPGVFLARLASTAYFRTMSTAEIAVSLPSHGAAEGPWCSYRNIEAWALGVPVLTIRPKNYFTFKEPEPGCWIEMAEDLSDLPAVISQALSDKGKLEEMGQAAMRYFDENFTPEQHARYVLGTIEKCLTPA